jgi:signal transduction histidine kinase
VSGFATLVWPPTGIALAALILFGVRLWPAIALGAFFANVATGAPWYSALCIASGNTLEAISAVYLLRRAGFQSSFDRVQDAFKFVVLAGVCSTLVSAVIGVVALWAWGRISGPEITVTFKAWWLGDMVGSLVVAPFLLAWWGPLPRRPSVAQPFELVALVLVAVVICSSIFPGLPFPKLFELHDNYFIFPVMLWAATRFGRRGAVTSVLLVTALSVWGMTLGQSTFSGRTLSESLTELQTFIAVLAVTTLLLAVAIAERRHTEKALAEALGQRDEFLSVASHELRTPVTSLILQLNLLQAQAMANTQKGLFSEQLRRSLDNFERSSLQLSTLLDKLLDVTRIRVGKLKLERELFDLRQTIQEVLARFSEDTSRANTPITFQASGPVEGSWDPLRIEQVITNLVSNAIKYGNSKPIVIRLQADTIRGVAIIHVIDRGIGISAEIQPRLFQRFERAAEDSLIQGLGLGLYISRQIADAHGGSISVSSRMGEGSEFRVELPMKNL